MSIALMDKFHRKREVRRLESIKQAYLKEYQELCTKYRAQLVPLLVPQGGGKYSLVQQLDAYIPITQEMIDKIVEATKKQNGTQPKQ